MPSRSAGDVATVIERMSVEIARALFILSLRYEQARPAALPLAYRFVIDTAEDLLEAALTDAFESMRALEPQSPAARRALRRRETRLKSAAQS